MNKRSNTGVSILIALTLVLFCFAQTSQAEKESWSWSRRSAAMRENLDCFQEWWGSHNLSNCTICRCRYTRAEIPQSRVTYCASKPAPLKVWQAMRTFRNPMSALSATGSGRACSSMIRRRPRRSSLPLLSEGIS
jgi:hypothetical protein